MQKKYNFPHASSERELAYCKNLTTQFIHSARQVIFSFSSQHEEVALRPSALIKAFQPLSEEALLFHPFVAKTDLIYQHAACETFEDNQGPGIAEDEIIQGGSKILQYQAACPFRAFAEFRLKARIAPPPTLGLSAADRGRLVHKTLEIIWRDLQNHARLSELDDNQLNELIQHSIQHAFDHLELVEASSARYYSIEKKRLQKLVTAWLQNEKQRPPFKVISLEQEREIVLNNITFSLRIDRLDELDNGKQLIIDYKTAKNVHIKDWFSERPNEPQLLLYCITDSESIIGVAFAQIHSDAVELKGISKIPLKLSGVKTMEEVRYSHHNEWEPQIHEWEKVISKLSADFMSGNASVDPKEIHQTCLYCQFQPLCRIHELKEQPV